MRSVNDVEIGAVEAFELCGGKLPTKRIDIVIARPVIDPLGDSTIYKEDGKYFIASIKEEK